MFHQSGEEVKALGLRLENWVGEKGERSHSRPRFTSRLGLCGLASCPGEVDLSAAFLLDGFVIYFSRLAPFIVSP